MHSHSIFELLPNEVLLEIFEFLSSIHIFQAFYLLNRRFDNLLLSLRLQVDLIQASKQTFDYHNYFLFPSAVHRIVAFRCEDTFDRLICHIHLSQFIALEYLSVLDLNVENLHLIVPHLRQFANLIDLNLRAIDGAHPTGPNELYFEEPMPTLQRCILDLNKRIIIEGDHTYPALEFLTINRCHMNDFASLLHIYAPQLRKLTVVLTDEFTTKKNFRQPDFQQSHRLESLVIKRCTIPFARIENQIFGLLPHLQRLQIVASGIEYVEGKRWENILSTILPCVKHFGLRVDFPPHQAPTAIIRTQILKSFETRFFLSHQWYFSLAYHPPANMIELFTLPLIGNKMLTHLYGTQTESTTTDPVVLSNCYQTITELSLVLDNDRDVTSLSFGHVQDLILISELMQNQPPPKMLLVDISRLVKFSQLQSLTFNGPVFPPGSLALLEYTPKLRTLSLSLNDLMLMTKSLNDPQMCALLKASIRDLTITSIDGSNPSILSDRLPKVFARLENLSLSLVNIKDLYLLTTLTLPNFSRTLKSLSISLVSGNYHHAILAEFMSWLTSFIHSRDLKLADIKKIGGCVNFCF